MPNNSLRMRVQGVTPEYVRDFRAAGLKPSVDQLIALKVQGVDAEYYRGLKEAGIDPDIDRLIALKVQGVTPGVRSRAARRWLDLTRRSSDRDEGSGCDSGISEGNARAGTSMRTRTI